MIERPPMRRELRGAITDLMADQKEVLDGIKRRDDEEEAKKAERKGCGE